MVISADERRFNEEIWDEGRDISLLSDARNDNLWLESLLDVVANDEEARQNWFIPTQLLDFVGYDVEDVWEMREQSNVAINHWVQSMIGFLIKQNKDLTKVLKRRLQRGRSATYELYREEETRGRA